MNLTKGFEYEYILMVDAFKQEFCKVVNEPNFSPPFKRYQKWLIRKLDHLNTRKEKAIVSGGFEDLKEIVEIGNYQYRIYSILSRESKMNIRVLYTISEDGYVILLKTFKEEKTANYTRTIAQAKNIIKSLAGQKEE